MREICKNKTCMHKKMSVFFGQKFEKWIVKFKCMGIFRYQKILIFLKNTLKLVTLTQEQLQSTGAIVEVGAVAAMWKKRPLRLSVIHTS